MNRSRVKMVWVVCGLALPLLLAAAWLSSRTAEKELSLGPPQVAVTEEAPVTTTLDIAPRLLTEVALAQGERARNSSKRATISFPDGGTRVAELRARPPLWDIRGDRPIKDQLPELWRAANAGDDRAAEALYRALSECTKAYRSEESLETAIRTLWETGDLVPPNPSDRVLKIPDPRSRAEHEDQLRLGFESCQGVTDADIADIDKWRNLALSHKNLYAMQMHAASLGRTEEGLRAWESAWEAGDRLALEFLGVLYSKGVGALPDGTPDRVRAYAHKFLNLKLQEAVSGDTPSQTRRIILAALRDDLSNEGGLLNPQQSDEALALAKDLSKNPNCCYVP